MLIRILITYTTSENISESKEKLIPKFKDRELLNRVWRIDNILISVLIASTVISLWVHFG